MSMLGHEIQPGDRVYIEQAWEDEAGQYHDAEATVLKKESIFLTLKFDEPEIDEFLEGAEYTIYDVEKI
jgi:hypothetical protein